MSLLKRLFHSGGQAAPAKKPRNSTPPVIETPWGPTTEAARYRAALNMRDDPAVRQRVEAYLQEKYGEVGGLAECERRYPEAYSMEGNS